MPKGGRASKDVDWWLGDLLSTGRASGSGGWIEAHFDERSVK
jgi:hypothetical protein